MKMLFRTAILVSAALMPLAALALTPPPRGGFPGNGGIVPGIPEPASAAVFAAGAALVMIALRKRSQ